MEEREPLADESTSNGICEGCYERFKDEAKKMKEQKQKDKKIRGDYRIVAASFCYLD
jgi:hypothetical protein